ncbi:MAG: orotidine 5'-phosphate decarboxylase / HUMPS family protein, partial [bacterium]
TSGLLVNQAIVAPLAKTRLDKRKKYLQIALNSTLEDARRIIFNISAFDRILIEAGTPLIKKYGMRAIAQLKRYSEVRIAQLGLKTPVYIVADIKTADMGEREVELAAQAGASGITCVGVAPKETIDAFISSCMKYGVDSMIDMMNVESPLLVLKKLQEAPDVVILHRGVDETEMDKEKIIPYYQINQIKGNCEAMVAVAGGDNIQEIRSAVFNGTDIVILWKAFYRASDEVGNLVNEFLGEIR